MNTHRQYTIAEFSPEWKERFLKTKELLTPLFGDNLVEIAHIGSTSVEGMWAKPQVDILVVVKNLNAVQEVYNSLITAGCTVHGRGYVAADDEYISIDNSYGERQVSIHTLGEGNPKIEEYKVFRDYLKEHSEERNQYIRTKKELFLLHERDYPAYYQGKKTLVEELLRRASIWSKILKKHENNG